ncbi:hypothetical protein ACEYW6_35360 [Nostoc sp. UIC 10607]|uniref:hypothetical protein n=1 Tax=Nostoc sp. UIC 10607 TaxID=3045935 RepID=UPI0039A0B2AA
MIVSRLNTTVLIFSQQRSRFTLYSRRLLKQIQNNRYTYETSHSAEIIEVALLVIGLVRLIGVIIRAMNL